MHRYYDDTTLDLIILDLEGTTPGADANQDDRINTVDLTTLEAIIAGIG